MNDESLINVLMAHDFFRDLEPQAIAFLAGNARNTNLASGEILFEHGQPADRFYLIRSGRITVGVPAIEGPSLEVQTLGPGEVLGWSWLIPPYRWNFRGQVIEAAEVIEFDGKVMLERCETDPAFGYPLMKRFAALMSERLEAARRKMMDQWNPAGFA
ncbi:MAG: Crp/Fnr family transcriptional regulator [Halofilum sp. (in: g-proteobacteria)]